MSNLKNILLNKKNGKLIWFMRQAGRYLPEFRELRSKNKDFVKLCLNSELSSEITLQPIKRFNIDLAYVSYPFLLPLSEMSKKFPLEPISFQDHKLLLHLNLLLKHIHRL